ncbi:MAG: M16 family metallopeptidase [Candidatus Zixiibacteriota bacterium]
MNIYLGNIIPGADNKNALAIKVATSILSNRLYHILREKQGLAYSVGASSTFDKNFGWFYSVIGTEAVNYQKAIDGIILQIDKLKLDGPTLGELRKAKNKIWGRLMSAKLSSINQAYYLGLDEYLGHPLGYDKQFLVSLSNVTAESIRRVASKYFRNDVYILATAGKKL